MKNLTHRVEKLEKDFRINENIHPCPDINTVTTEDEARNIYLCMLKKPRKYTGEENSFTKKKMNAKEAERLYLKHVKNVQH